ncbi:MAG: sulfatase [Planctomycetaceae bacterium]
MMPGQDRPRSWNCHALLLGISVLLLCCVGPAVQAADHPNVVLIVADDLGGADLGCYGSRYHQTPHLDKLAADGIRFAQAYAAAPVCSPTRAALMTGKYPARLRLTDWLPGRPDRNDQPLFRPALPQQLPLEEITLAERFQKAGYATAHVGKWHLGGAGFGPLEQGFERNIAGDETGTPLSYIAPFGLKGRLMPGLEQADPGEYLTDRLTSEAVRFITDKKDSPFFLYLAHYAPHTPLTARPDLEQKWQARERPQNPGAQANAVYAAMLESVDESVGRIRQTLAELGLTEKTLVIFTSDNGGLATAEGPRTPSTSNAPLREGKGFLYEGGIRIPLLACGPGVAGGGRVVETPVSSYDLVPTLADLCSLGPVDQVDGVNTAPVWRDTGAVAERTLFWHYPHYSNQRARPGGAIRKGNHKLIEFYETGRRELFDVSQDRSESRNLAAERPDLVEALGAELVAWRQSVGATRMTPNPDFVPNPQGDDRVVVLLAKTANVQGIMLRYEPLPHKETLGFWVQERDWAEWDFTLREPGHYQVEILQGCGPGSGGSTVELRLAGQVVSFTVEETKHFQDFKPRIVGEFHLTEPGRQTLQVVPTRKPGVAVMDLRQVRLLPVK